MKLRTGRCGKLSRVLLMFGVIVAVTTACDNTGSASGGKGGQSGMPASHYAPAMPTQS